MTLENEHKVTERPRSLGADAVNYSEYLPLLGDTDLTLDQQIILLRAIGAIMQSFVADAFGDNPTTHALAARDEKGAISRSAMIESNHQTPTETFARAQRREE